MKSTYLIFFLIINVWGVIAQKFKYVTYEGDQVPFKKVNQVLQDIHQYTWLATDQGLYRFNGTTFQEYNTSSRSRHIKCIIPWTKDTLLFSNDAGVYKLFYKENEPQIHPFSLSDSSKKRISYPEQLFKDSNNRLWIAQQDGAIFLKNLTDGSLQKTPLITEQKPSEMFFGEDKFGIVWVLVPQNGLYYFEETTKEFIGLNSYNDALHFYVEDNHIWLLGNQIQKLQIDNDQNVLSQNLIDNKGLYFYTINKDISGTYFLASDQGIYTLKDGQSQYINKIFGSNDPHRVDELRYTSINHLYFSPDQIRSGGKIWVSTSNGFGLLSSSYFQSVSGMSHDNVFSISAGKDNEVLVSENTVNRIKNVDGQISFEPIEGVDRATAITSDNNNTWFGTADATIFQYKERVLHATYDMKDRGGSIFYMFTDHVGDNWFCQAPTDEPIVGVAKIDVDGRVILYDEANGLVSRILVIREGNHSELYAAGIGSNSYLYKYNREADVFENKSLPFSFKVSRNFEVHDLSIDDKGIVWLGTTDGLLKYDTQTIQRIDLGPYTKNEIRSVCVIPDGEGLWLATDTNGLVHLDKQGDYVIFDEKSGTLSKVASYRSMIIDSNKQLWVGTAEGAVYSTQSNPKPLTTKTPICDTISINNESQKFKKPLRFKEDIAIALHINTIIYPGDNIKYQYKIYEENTQDEGLNIPWSSPTENNQIVLQKLKAGTYFLLVKAQKQGGYSWSDPLKIDLEIKEKWYKTFLGMLFLILAGILLLWYFLRLLVFRKTKNLKTALSRKQKELSEKEEVIVSQTNILKAQKQELKSAGTNIDLLYQLIQEIPQRAVWDEALPVLAKLIEFPTGVDAFELAFKRGEKIRYRGCKREDSKIKDRNEGFNEKENLATYALLRNKSVVIGDFDLESTQYINKKNDEGYPSRMLVPFEQINGTVAVFCIFGKEKNKFTQRGLTMIQILTTFLSVKIVDELK